MQSLCLVCLEPMADSQLLGVLDCCHKYHMDCIIEWSKHESACPQCKAAFRTVDGLRHSQLAFPSLAVPGQLPSSLNFTSDAMMLEPEVLCHRQCRLRGTNASSLQSGRHFCIQCDHCAALFHGMCCGFASELHVPERWVCWDCKGLSSAIAQPNSSRGASSVAGDGMLSNGGASNGWASLPWQPQQQNAQSRAAPVAPGPSVSERSAAGADGRLRYSSHSAHTGNADVSTACEVCGHGAGRGSAVLRCCACDIIVHQACYGVRFLPEGAWRCGPCAAAGGAAGAAAPSIVCRLCPNSGGALKRCKDGGWAHVTCCVWLPGVCFLDQAAMEPIASVDGRGLASLLHSQEAESHSCSVCTTRRGPVVPCQRGCGFRFHPECGRRAGSIYMETEVAARRANAAGTVLVALCPTHGRLRVEAMPLDQAHFRQGGVNVNGAKGGYPEVRNGAASWPQTPQAARFTDEALFDAGAASVGQALWEDELDLESVVAAAVAAAEGASAAFGAQAWPNTAAAAAAAPADSRAAVVVPSSQAVATQESGHREPRDASRAEADPLQLLQLSVLWKGGRFEFERANDVAEAAATLRLHRVSWFNARAQRYCIVSSGGDVLWVSARSLLGSAVVDAHGGRLLFGGRACNGGVTASYPSPAESAALAAASQRLGGSAAAAAAATSLTGGGLLPREDGSADSQTGMPNATLEHSDESRNGHGRKRKAEAEVAAKPDATIANAPSTAGAAAAIGAPAKRSRSDESQAEHPEAAPLADGTQASSGGGARTFSSQATQCDGDFFSSLEVQEKVDAAAAAAAADARAAVEAKIRAEAAIAAAAAAAAQAAAVDEAAATARAEAFREAAMKVEAAAALEAAAAAEAAKGAEAAAALAPKCYQAKPGAIEFLGRRLVGSARAVDNGNGAKVLFLTPALVQKAEELVLWPSPPLWGLWQGDTARAATEERKDEAVSTAGAESRHKGSAQAAADEHPAESAHAGPATAEDSELAGAGILDQPKATAAAPNARHRRRGSDLGPSANRKREVDLEEGEIPLGIVETEAKEWAAETAARKAKLEAEAAAAAARAAEEQRATEAARAAAAEAAAREAERRAQEAKLEEAAEPPEEGEARKHREQLRAIVRTQLESVLRSALEGSGFDVGLAAGLAEGIEQEMALRLYSAPREGRQYKEKYKQLLLVFQNRRNAGLLAAVAGGSITAEALVKGDAVALSRGFHEATGDGPIGPSGVLVPPAGGKGGSMQRNGAKVLRTSALHGTLLKGARTAH